MNAHKKPRDLHGIEGTNETPKVVLLEMFNFDIMSIED